MNPCFPRSLPRRPADPFDRRLPGMMELPNLAVRRRHYDDFLHKPVIPAKAGIQKRQASNSVLNSKDS